VSRRPCAARDGSRGGGSAGGRCYKRLRLTGAPVAASEGRPLHTFSALIGRSGRSAGGVATGTPGTIGTVSRRARCAWRAPTGAGAAPFPRDPGGLEHAPSGEGMAGSIRGWGRGWMKRGGNIFSEAAKPLIWRHDSSGTPLHNDETANCNSPGFRLRSIRATRASGSGSPTSTQRPGIVRSSVIWRKESSMTSCGGGREALRDGPSALLRVREPFETLILRSERKRASRRTGCRWRVFQRFSKAYVTPATAGVPRAGATCTCLRDASLRWHDEILVANRLSFFVSFVPPSCPWCLDTKNTKGSRRARSPNDQRQWPALCEISVRPVITRWPGQAGP
jgi:hypothetical protein